MVRFRVISFKCLFWRYIIVFTVNNTVGGEFHGARRDDNTAGQQQNYGSRRLSKEGAAMQTKRNMWLRGASWVVWILSAWSLLIYTASIPARPRKVFSSAWHIVGTQPTMAAMQLLLVVRWWWWFPTRDWKSGHSNLGADSVMDSLCRCGPVTNSRNFTFLICKTRMVNSCHHETWVLNLL